MYGKERQYVLCGKLAQDASRRVNVCHQVRKKERERDRGRDGVVVREVEAVMG